MDGNFYSYSRISTKEKNDLQSFKRQDKALIKYEKEKELFFVRAFKDDCSGSTFDREDWNRLYRIVRNGDTIVFKELSRFTRQAEKGYELYLELMNKGINLIFIDNPTMSTEYIKKLFDLAKTQDLVTKTALEGTIKLLMIVELDRVEKERLILVKRIKDGIAASSNTQGRVKGSLDKLTLELKEDIIKYIEDKERKLKQTHLMRKYNISRNTLKKYINNIIVNS